MYDYKWQSRHHKALIIKSNWQLTSEHSALSKIFGSLDAVFALPGETITRDGISEVIRVEHEGIRYYVKRYRKAGKGLRKYFGRPRIQNEWRNLERFAEWGIPTAPIMAYGMERSFGRFIRGAMITREITGTVTLEELAERNDVRLKDRFWITRISQKLADITHTLHQNRFAHNDLKWRNILVDSQDNLYLIDCPLGDFWRGLFLRHRMLKDISNLDRIAQYKLSHTQRLRFYLQYTKKRHLTASDKKLLRHLLAHPSGRVSSFGRN